MSEKRDDRPLLPGCKLYKDAFEAAVPKGSFGFWEDARNEGPYKECGFDFMDKAFHDRCAGKAQTSSSLHMLAERDGSEVLAGDILIPVCADKWDEVLATPDVDFCTPMKINQLHVHTAPGGCGTAHLHVEFPISKWGSPPHCARKIASWMGKLVQYQSRPGRH